MTKIRQNATKGKELFFKKDSAVKIILFVNKIPGSVLLETLRAATGQDLCLCHSARSHPEGTEKLHIPRAPSENHNKGHK